MTSSLLAGRTALVTGASRGIGMAIAERFAAEGATVAVTARTVEPGTSPFEGSLEETVERITKDGGHAVAIAADLSRPEERERLIQETEAVIGPIDILVNNAAVTFFTPIADFAPKRQQLMFEVQVYAPMDLAQRVLPGMAAAGQGWILNISSGASRHPSLPPGPTPFGQRCCGPADAGWDRTNRDADGNTRYFVQEKTTRTEEPPRSDRSNLDATREQQ